MALTNPLGRTLVNWRVKFSPMASKRKLMRKPTSKINKRELSQIEITQKVEIY